MEKRKIPTISILFYVIGILFLAIAAFMLVTSISYTAKYVDSYGASFADMWSNSVQYVITQFAPYLGIGFICIGIGKAISLFDTSKPCAEESGELEPSQWAEAAEKAKEVQLSETSRADVSGDIAGIYKKIDESLDYLVDNIEATREIIGIKIEEKEKRDAFRLQEMGKGLTSAFVSSGRMHSDHLTIEVPEVLETPKDLEALETPETAVAVAASATVENLAQPPVRIAEPTPAKPIAMFRVAGTMAMPACPKTSFKPIPLFTEAGTMAMPSCPKIKDPISLFRVAGTMAMPACPKISAIEEESDTAIEPSILDIFMREERIEEDKPEKEEIEQEKKTFQDEMPELEAFKRKDTLSMDDLFDALEREKDK